MLLLLLIYSTDMLLIYASDMQPLLLIYSTDMLIWYADSLSLICTSIASPLTFISNCVEERGRSLLIKAEEEKWMARNSNLFACFNHNSASYFSSNLELDLRLQLQLTLDLACMCTNLACTWHACMQHTTSHACNMHVDMHATCNMQLDMHAVHVMHATCNMRQLDNNVFDLDMQLWLLQLDSLQGNSNFSSWWIMLRVPTH